MKWGCALIETDGRWKLKTIFHFVSLKSLYQDSVNQTNIVVVFHLLFNCICRVYFHLQDRSMIIERIKMTIFFFFLGIMVSSDKCRDGQTINKKGKTITINLILVILWPILLWEGDVQSRLAMYLSVFIIILCTSLGSSLSFPYIPSHVYLNLFLIYLPRFMFIFFL